MIDGDLTWVVVGYVIMRLIAVPQWIRAGAANPAFRGTAARYAVGITVLQVFWTLILFVPQSARTPMFVALVLLEVCVPVLAERHNRTPWHAHHLTERYSLFTIILLGESILASANAVFAAVQGHEHVAPFIVVAVLSLVIIASMWWVYFAQPMHDRFSDLRSAMTFGYFHYVIFAAAGAFSAGVEVTVAMAEGHANLTDVGARATLAVPVGMFFLGVWWLALRRRLSAWANAVIVLLGFAIAASVLVPFSLGLIAACTVAIVAIVHVTSERPA
jgi:low temperature requirement protein LtrA